MLAEALVARGADAIIAGGSDSTSNAEIKLPQKVVHALAPMAFGKASPADMLGVSCSDVSWSDVGTVDCSSVNNNISADPMFFAPVYSVRKDSPVLDHGPDPLATYAGDPCHDMDGGPRLHEFLILGYNCCV